MKKVFVISLGGSLIIPEKMDYPFLNNFKDILRKFYNLYKFVIVCGGGTIARKYIEALRKEGKSKYEQSQAGIRATRMNALFMIKFFGKEANDSLSMNMKEIENDIHKNNVVFCGALRFAKDSTSDGTSAKIAHYFHANLINMTNVKGLYTEDPNKNSKAKFIPRISWKRFEKMALKTRYEPGQHFVLDQKAAIVIRKNKIPTYIIGKNLKNLEKILKNQRFEGTLIED